MDESWILERFHSKTIRQKVVGFGHAQKSIDNITYCELEDEFFDSNRVVKGQIGRQRRITESWWTYYRLLHASLSSSVKNPSEV